MHPKLHASVFAPQRRVGRRRANREKRRRRRAYASFLTGSCDAPSTSTIRLLEHPHKRSMSQIRAPRSGARAEARRQSKPSNRHTRIETLERPADDALSQPFPILPSVPKRDAPVRPIRQVVRTMCLPVHEPDRAPHAPAPTRQRGVGVSSRRCNKRQTCLVGRDVLRQN